MAVGFRSFLKVEPDEPVIDTVIARMAEWVREKAIDAPVSGPGWYHRDDNDIVTVLEERIDDARVYRWRRHHPYAAGGREMLRITLTAAEYAGQEGWLWTEVELPPDSGSDPGSGANIMSPPGFLRGIISELPCLDGRTPLTAEPQWVALSHLPDLMDFLADETRRGPVYMLSQSTRDTAEFTGWSYGFGWELIGLGTSFLLNNVVEEAFNDMVGPRLAVPSGCVRTYQPAVNLDDPLDPRRHQVLSMEKIQRFHPRALSHMLGVPQRERATCIGIPADVQKVNWALIEREREEQARARRAVPPGDGPAGLDELRAENVMLNEQVGMLRHMLRSYQRSESVVRMAMQVLEEHVGARGPNPDCEPGDGTRHASVR